MEPRISMIGLGVQDLVKSKAFYEKLGWQASERSNENIVFIPLNGICICLYNMEKLAEDAQLPFQELNAFRGCTLAHNCRSKEEVKQHFQQAIAAGAKVLKEPQNTFWGGYGAYFSDLDGHVWELAYNPFIELDEMGHLVF